MRACTQPGCTGRIVDGYCDVCGSPAGAVLSAPEGAAASAVSPASAVEAGQIPVGRGSGVSARPGNDLMQTCTEPGCTGTIVDGYCDVCGSPVDAVPFVPAAASVASPGSAVEASPTVDSRGAGVSARSRNGLISACTQSGCTGTIIDGYCDVCGSPAGAVPLVPAAASALAPALADEPALTAVPASASASAPVNEEIPTQPVHQVQMPRQQLSTQEMADPGSADRGAVDGQEANREKVDPAADDTGKELAEGKPDDAEDYRTRVEEAHLPDDVREAALCEVGKLERTSDKSPETDDIRIWLDTILDLPWSTEITESIDIQGSREVEATLRGLIEPPAADIEKADTAADVEDGDTAEVEATAADVEDSDTAKIEPVAADIEKADTAADVENAEAEIGPGAAGVEHADTAAVEPVAADLEKADTAPAGPEHDDTVKLPAVPAVLGGGPHQRPQLPKQQELPEQQVPRPEPVQTAAKKRRFGYVALAMTVLAALLIGALLFAASRDRGVTPQSVPTVTTTATKPTSEPTIQFLDLPKSAKPFETVRIKGTYRGGAETFLRVERWEDGKWLAFPVPTKTDQSGKFTAYVEFSQPGRYQLRVVHLGSGMTSKTFVLVVRG
jgi:hypothetical protein